MKISEMILNGINRVYLLPSIQREFVWLVNLKERRVEKLFDSIMQGYPFGNILVWEVPKNINDEAIHFEVYKFIQNYDKDNPHNEIANLNGIININLVLDGQQRLSALNLGLRGRYKFTNNRKKREQKLYINLFSDIENDIDNEYGYKYEFKFLQDISNTELQYWFEVGKVLDFDNKDTEEFKEYWDAKIRQKTDDTDKIIIAKKILGRLHQSICCDKNLNITKITGNDEKALNVFVRTNDGGVKLEKADLLMSYMEANKDIFKPNGARKEINDFVDSLNKEEVDKSNYYLKKDDILKASLVLSDLEVQYKLKNFNSVNLNAISINWEEIKKYLQMTIELIARFGFSYKNIISNNSLIPIAYFLKKENYNNNFIASQDTNIIQVKNEIIKWFVVSQLTGAFGSSSDATLTSIRESINNGKTFKDINLGKVIEKEDVNKWINRESCNSKYSHLLLLLITDYKYWDKCHQDHIFPKSKFNEYEYSKLNLNDKDKEFYNDYCDSILNLQLLNPYSNISKMDDEFFDWSDSQTKSFLKSSLIPTDRLYTFSLFKDFILKRKKMMINKIYKILY